MNTMLITTPTNIRYLTGFVGVEERDAYALLTKSKTYFFTNSLYLEQAKKLSPILISRENPISKEIRKICKKLKIRKLGFEETNLTVAELTKLKRILDGITLVATRDRIEKLRQIKRPDEIANIKKACAITDACFDFIIKKLKPGVTESDVAWEIETFFRKNNAGSAFSPIVAFGKNSSMPHYNSLSNGAKKIQSLALNSDIILLDFGAKYNGYCADMTRVVFVGKPKQQWIDTYNTVLAAQQAAIAAINKYFDLSINRSERSISGAAIDAVARAIIKQAKLPPYSHSLGHNVGLDIHEGPRLNYKKDKKFVPGMVFSIEPGVYLLGRYGIRIEDLVLLKKSGIEILSKTTKKIVTI